jgi:hypothetical protein
MNRKKTANLRFMGGLGVVKLRGRQGRDESLLGHAQAGCSRARGLMEPNALE